MFKIQDQEKMKYSCLVEAPGNSWYFKYRGLSSSGNAQAGQRFSPSSEPQQAMASKRDDLGADGDNVFFVHCYLSVQERTIVFAQGVDPQVLWNWSAMAKVVLDKHVDFV